MDNIKIERMAEADIKEVSTVMRTVFNEQGDDWSEEISLQEVQENFQGDANFVARDGERIVGSVIAYPISIESERGMYVDTFVVLGEYRGKGVGKLLWNKVEEYAKKNSYKFINVLANPKWSSYDLYKRMGFKESGWVDLYKRVKQ